MVRSTKTTQAMMKLYGISGFGDKSMEALALKKRADSEFEMGDFEEAEGLLIKYYACNRLAEKSDMYGFGVLLLELMASRTAVVIIGNVDNIHIIQWFSPFGEGGDIRNIVDAWLAGNFDTSSVWKAVETAMECLPPISIQRPTMSHVVIQVLKKRQIYILQVIKIN
ncbi:probable LRR receptor-like serine/threonine-protein kinase At5g59680 [Mangifera indica]|uniref:probable LRR receptor-like serine/threonine-protein kinase At5g59680 n=1 Tax=Mangifera indica TaxID=29780 RepID=UPI001CFC1906|nr:probable LRR receptor-like serine/threonine-protein kinase At5g59680 [Mangifera indica]